jgi:hypothetical protein
LDKHPLCARLLLGAFCHLMTGDSQLLHAQDPPSSSMKPIQPPLGSEAFWASTALHRSQLSGPTGHPAVVSRRRQSHISHGSSMYLWTCPSLAPEDSKGGSSALWELRTVKPLPISQVTVQSRGHSMSPVTLGLLGSLGIHGNWGRRPVPILLRHHTTSPGRTHTNEVPALYMTPSHPEPRLGCSEPQQP